MTLNDIEKLYTERQSCRKYDINKKIDRDILKRVVEAALLAPSACNSQPWRVIVTNNAEKVKAIASNTHNMGMNKFSDNCTAFAVITETTANLTEKAGAALTGRDFIANDLGIFTAHLVLAAKAAGIDSCILGIFDEKGLKSLLSIPEKNRVRLVVAMGHAEEGDVIRPKKRKPQDETVQFILE